MGYRSPVFALPFALLASSAACGADIPKSHDHPLVSRFKGADIVGFREADFGRASLPSGPGEKHIEASGRMTDIVYRIPQGKSAVEVLENYRKAFAAAGFESAWTCGPGTRDGGCGGFRFAGDLADPVIATLGGDSTTMTDLLDATNNHVSYVLATHRHGGGATTVALMVSQDDDQPVGVLLRVIEATEMAQGQVKVDADAMTSALRANGKIALYGLHFATDSATITADSKATLSEMAKALKASPGLKVFIVGHTDNTGSLAHNETLSQERAAAVVRSLAKDYGVAADRLAAKGVASYSPVAANTSDAGKAQNRRVEMVAQ
ncbi:OmpA family protein [Luteibacter yeojuensis]|uniref:DUF4892 domain-containing protein n=1 Tax=Luteibacter yeojuensis TaxID=345309 RepID=A0A7X5TNS1_9GAMM|nr:OmpA family protein [Luteibacter yeojuensis]NID13984.1 DUF4892 domain-containing protein [Luteibacter yeojuensis]